MYYVKVLIFYNRNALKMKKEGIVRGQELMKTLLIELVNYNVLCKSINVLQQKCIENEDGRYCQRSGMNENITNRIGQL